MDKLKAETGYISMKEQYEIEMAKVYGKLENDTTMTAPDDMDRYVIENWDALEEELDDATEQNKEYINPIQMRNNIIESLEKEISELKEAAKKAEKERYQMMRRRQKT